jgi:outer membrane protein TolC
MNGKDMIMPMVSISIPVYRKKYLAQGKETELLKTATKYNYSYIENRLQAELFEAIQKYNDAKRRIPLYADQSELAKKSLDIMIKAYSASESTLTDLLKVLQQILDYELKESEALADFNISVALLKRLMATDHLNN